MSKDQKYSVEEVGSMLKQTRYLKAYSLRETADLLSVCYQTLWNIENAKTKSIHPLVYKTLMEFIFGKNDGNNTY